MNSKKQIFARYTTLLLGAAILSFGLFNVHSQSGVTEGGILGTTLLIQHWFGISPGVSELILDLICYALGYKLLGKDFLKYSIVASSGYAVFYTLWEWIGPVLPSFAPHPMIAAILGGIFVGVGVGLVVRIGGAAGGDDALALLVNKYTRFSIAQSYFITDAIVLILSLSYIPLRRIAFSFVTVTLSGFLIDRIQKLGKAPDAQQA